MFISFPTHLYSSLVMNRQGISPSIYNNDELDATITLPTPRCKLKWRRSKPSSIPTSDLPHLREDAQVHMLPSYHLRQGHVGIDTITTTNVKVKSSPHQPPLNDFTISLGIFTKRLQGIFAYGQTTSSPTRTSRLRSREAPQAQVCDFHELLRPRH